MKTKRHPLAMALLFLLNANPSRAQIEGHYIETNANHTVAAIQDTETTAQRDARMAWWRNARFCHRPAYRSQDVIAILEPADDRRNKATA